MNLPNLTAHHRGQLHYKPTIWGKNTTKTKMGLLHRNVSFMSKKSSQDVEEGSSGEDSDAETPKTKKKPAKRGRKKATIDTSDGHAKEGQSDTEDASLEEPKIVKMRGRKKGNLQILHSRVLFLLYIGQWALRFC